MEKSSRVGDATDDNVVLVHFTVGIKVVNTDTHSEYCDTSANEDNSFRNHIR